MNGSNILECIREDDFIEYFLFPDLGFLSEDEQELILNETLQKCEDIVRDITRHHLWHKDGFSLRPRTSNTNKLLEGTQKNENLPPHLYGVTHFGENIEDEWLIVYIVLELTRQIPKLIGRMIDVDGEFLLIEAADVLPEWVNPETAENRVYLHDGKIHIIEPTFSEGKTRVNINEVVKCIYDDAVKTVASTEIQNAVFKRIEGYPKKSRKTYILLGCMFQLELQLL
ncbi:hypothetical protein HHI36_018886 [Cryptolaemus montrouzieri]|uniref:Uncharacterized protein n=1 Tax=Cryptolaemus montrouzieri TaxID=559131 RepID=A0ABD2P245_9CUCU